MLRRLLGEGWGIRNLEGIGDPNETENRLRVLRLAGTVGVSLGAIAVLASIANFVVGVRIPNYSPVLVFWIPATGAALATLVFPLASRLPLWFVHVGAVIVNVALFIVAWNAGETYVFALLSYIAVGTVLAMACQLRALIPHLVVMGVLSAVIMALRASPVAGGPKTATAGFIVLSGVMFISAGCAAWLVGRLRVLARREHDARRDAETARAELEVASGHKSAFLANMSHELRTPLNAIVGFSEALNQGMAGDLNETQREYISDIRTAGRHLVSLINDVLDLSKVEAGRYDLDVSHFFLPNALDEGLRLIRDRAASRSITVTLHAEPEVGWLDADERMVRQIVFNLLSNAVKFTPGGGRVDLRARAADGSVEITVHDTGVGIAVADQERIFEEFTRADPTSTEEGTGLGLALSKRFVELHGGRIWVDSSPGAGSTFGFTLPVVRTARGTDAASV